jgi:hypothetical protein
MRVLDAARAWCDEESGNRFFRRARLEDAMRGWHSIHVPHFQHFSPRSTLVSARDRLSAQGIEITATFAILFGVLMLLSFWAAVAR